MHASTCKPQESKYEPRGKSQEPWRGRGAGGRVHARASGSIMFYDLLGDPLDAVIAHCAVQWLAALSRCSRPLQQQVRPLVRQAEEESERLLCEHLGSSREELTATNTITWPNGLPEPQRRHLGAWLLPGNPLAHVTRLRVPDRRSPGASRVVTFRLPGATALNLSGSDLTDEMFMALTAFITVNATLTTLNLDTNSIGDEGAIAIAESLKVNASLTTLKLYGNSIGDEGGIAIGKALGVNATLTSLNLSYNKIGPKGAIAIAEALKVNVTLKTLVLSYNKIGAEGGVAIGEALAVNASLTDLNLEYTGIGNEGGTAIGEALKVNASLKSLNLQACRIGVKGGIAIAEALKVNVTLTNLNLRHNILLCQKGKDALHRVAKPTLELAL